jgi:hypothetical protein
MWTVEHASSASPEKWDIMIVQSEAEALTQAARYIGLGLIVNAIKTPSGTVAYTKDQIKESVNKKTQGETPSSSGTARPAGI